VSPRYLADTNVYVLAANNVDFRQRFETFVRHQGPLEVSTVVVSEVLIDIPDPGRHAAVVRALTAGAELHAPAAADWLEAGTAIARLGGAAVTKSRSVWNDALLAAQCARLDAVVVTSNTADFQRLGRVIPVRTAAPFPPVGSRGRSP
jgi:predicted nucleic acid-binding protein